ncbi:MAG: toll/interleukin-1 receptor domain-containing protein [Phycisphaerales bacterium]
MADIFISHSTEDAAFAEQAHRFMESQGVSVFLAPFSIAAGQNWTDEVKRNLKCSSMVLFLASRAACNSPFVQQELGGAFFGDKRIVPVVWEIAPEELPGWVSQSQAVDIRKKTVDEIRTAFSAIAQRLKIDKRNFWVVAGALVAAYLILSSG